MRAIPSSKVVFVITALAFLSSCGDNSNDVESIPFNPDGLTSQNVAGHQPDSNLIGQASVALDQGRARMYQLNKTAGRAYLIEFATRSGDFDLYGHWNKRFDPPRCSWYSGKSGLADESYIVTADESGPFYIVAWAKSGGDGTLSVYELDGVDRGDGPCK